MPHIVRCDVSLTPSEIPADLHDAAVVVMDVLRATTTIVYALQNGASKVIPCEEPEDALALRERLGADRVLLGGERDSVRIPGFDLDNSPLSYMQDRVREQTIVFTTTNGTRALRRAAHASPRAILCGAFVNVSAVVEALLNLRADRVLLACAGSEGALSLEDVLLAGAISERLMRKVPAVDLADVSKAAVLAYRSATQDLLANIASSAHAQNLIRAGFSDDVSLAAQLDTSAVVPVLHGGEIALAH